MGASLKIIVSKVASVIETGIASVHAGRGFFYYTITDLKNLPFLEIPNGDKTMIRNV